MNAADDFPVFDVGEKHAGADYVVECRTGLFQGFFGDGEDAAGLSCGVFVFCADGTGAGKMDGVPDADGAGEADDGLVGRTAGMFLRIMVEVFSLPPMTR